MPSETTIDSKLLLDVYVRVNIMINFINRFSGHANNSQRIQQKRENNDVANFCFITVHELEDINFNIGSFLLGTVTFLTFILTRKMMFGRDKL